MGGERKKDEMTNPYVRDEREEGGCLSLGKTRMLSVLGQGRRLHRKLHTVEKSERCVCVRVCEK